MFVESAGLPDVIAGGDPANAAGLTQILAPDRQSLLGMHIDLAAQPPAHRRRSTRRPRAARSARGARLERARARIDDRFDPRKALAATVRYLQLAQQHFGRLDLAFESYHMGIGNLQRVLDLYDGGHAVPVRAAVLRHRAGPPPGRVRRCSRASATTRRSYYWRVLGAEQIMRLYRTDRPALERLTALQTEADSNAQVLHPPDRTPTLRRPRRARPRVRDPHVPAAARQRGARWASLRPRAWARSRRSSAATPALYRGLRPAALDMLIALAARVRALSGGREHPDRDEHGQRSALPAAARGQRPPGRRRLVVHDRPPVRRRAQAAAFQAMLDRLQALNLIAWERFPSEIEVTVASDASQALVHGP